MLTVRGQRHSFSTHERVFLWKCQSFWNWECLDLSGTRTPDLRIHAECSDHLKYQGQTFAVPCFWILVLAVKIFLSKVNIWDVNCARATAFIFWHTNGCSCESVKRFWDKKCLDLRGTRTPNLRIHAWCVLWSLHITKWSVSIQPCYYGFTCIKIQMTAVSYVSGFVSFVPLLRSRDWRLISIATREKSKSTISVDISNLTMHRLWHRIKISFKTQLNTAWTNQCKWDTNHELNVICDPIIRHFQNLCLQNDDAARWVKL